MPVPRSAQNDPNPCPLVDHAHTALIALGLEPREEYNCSSVSSRGLSSSGYLTAATT